MSCVIQLIETAAGEPTEFDGQYVRYYDPTYVHPEGYDGGILEVTPDPKQAMQFPNVEAAMEKWRQPYGVRADGKPNRPLTAWMVLFVSEEREAAWPTKWRRF